MILKVLRNKNSTRKNLRAQLPFKNFKLLFLKEGFKINAWCCRQGSVMASRFPPSGGHTLGNPLSLSVIRPVSHSLDWVVLHGKRDG